MVKHDGQNWSIMANHGEQKGMLNDLDQQYSYIMIYPLLVVCISREKQCTRLLKPYMLFKDLFM